MSLASYATIAIHVGEPSGQFSIIIMVSHTYVAICTLKLNFQALCSNIIVIKSEYSLQLHGDWCSARIPRMVHIHSIP